MIRRRPAQVLRPIMLRRAQLVPMSRTMPLRTALPRPRLHPRNTLPRRLILTPPARATRTLPILFRLVATLLSMGLWPEFTPSQGDESPDAINGVPTPKVPHMEKAVFV